MNFVLIRYSYIEKEYLQDFTSHTKKYESLHKECI